MDNGQQPVSPQPARRAGAAAWAVLVERRDILAVIALGGAAGSVARWGVGHLFPSAPGQLPWATVVVNVSGAFLLGALMVFVNDNWPPSRYVRPFLGVGVLGGFTTFSTAMLDIHALLAHGQATRAAVYLSGTLLVGLGAVWLGLVVARTVVARTAVAWRHASHRRRRQASAAPPGADAIPGSRTGVDELTDRPGSAR